jgi:broad specificity phosphatase PhoE
MGAVYLLRHGQASFGGADYDVLSDRGAQQAKVLGEELRRREPVVHAVWSGRLRRQRDTATACLSAMGLDLAVQPDERWDEYDHVGVLSTPQPSLDSDQDVLTGFQQQLDDALSAWIDGTAAAGTSGTWRDFSARSSAALDEVAAALPKGGSALVFTSAGVVAALATRFLGLTSAGYLALNRTQANCGITKIVTGRSGLNLVSLNEHGHFEGPHRDLLTYR